MMICLPTVLLMTLTRATTASTGRMQGQTRRIVQALLSFLDPMFPTIGLAHLCLLRANAGFSSLAR